MRTEKGLRIEWLVIGLTSLVMHSSCGAKKQTNEGFPLTLEELNANDYEDSFWKNVREKLQISPIEGRDEADLVSGLLGLPEYLLDTDAATVEVTTQAAGFVATAEQSVCAEIEVPLMDMNPGAAIGLSDAFSINGLVPTTLALGAKVYRMRYKLKADTEFRQAIITVPKLSPALAHAAVATVGVQTETAGAYGYPILMYGHAGANGLAYEEIASSLGVLQSGFIVAAPVFPGEPLCKTYDANTQTCTGSNIAFAALGTAQPYVNDVTDYLGLHDCMKTFAGGAAKAYLNPLTNAGGSEDLSAKVVKISAQAQTFFASTNPVKAAAAGAPVTIAGGVGRGAAVAGLALARAGAYNTVFGGTDASAITALAGKGVKPPMFSCSLLVAPQATFISGINRLLLEYWVREESNVLTATDRAAAELIPGFASIHAKLKAIRADTALDTEAQAAAIVAYIKSIDLVNHTQLLHFGLRNFGKLLTSDRLAGTDATLANTSKSNAQGSLLLMHGAADKVAHLGNSALLSSYGVSVTSALAETGLLAGIRWLSLAINPPEASLDEKGELPATDSGHVNSANFTGGTSGIVGGLDSNVTYDEFLELTPSALIAKWMATQCTSAMNANSGL